MSSGKSHLITGGSRSGKSSYALNLAAKARKPFYIATGWAGDKEMEDRIKRHKQERGKHWTTIEEQIEISAAILEAEAKGADVIVVDCLTFWVSNIMFSDNIDFDDQAQKLLATIPNVETELIFVTNELGSGIVPAEKLSREFRDNAGFINQWVAKLVDRVTLTVCGCPIEVKKSI